MVSLSMKMAGKRLLDDWGSLSQKCLWKDVVVNRDPSLSGRISPSLRQLILGMRKQSKSKSNYTQNEKGKLCQLTLVAFSSMFIKGNYARVKENIKYRVLSKSPPRLNIYENLIGLVDYNWCLSRLITKEYTEKSCDGK